MKTQVAIVGSGPSGLLLGHLLRAAGIDCVIVERQGRAHVESRIRAGVLETVTTDLMHRLGISARMDAEGLIEDGFNLADGERLIRIDIKALTGRHVMVYGQTELTRDLIAAAPERGLKILFEAKDVALHGVDGDRPAVSCEIDGESLDIEADFIAGCDGFHGPSRKVIVAAGHAREYEREYPFGWLGILADVPPCHPELIYSNDPCGFALASMRSATRSRYYIQVSLTEKVEDWPEDRLWDELARRFDPISQHGVARGPALEMSIAPLRSYVFETMRHGRLFLAGDAAHIVPPTGAKGLNLAASDVAYLADALIAHYRSADDRLLTLYEARALARIWKAERFSWYLTKLMHRFPGEGAFEHRMQTAELDYVAGSQAMQKAIAENYVGLPL
ncbi:MULTISPECIES: 4-hydroxybenzoate 3-monooxygenase [unclassified Sphingomonas]|uniref:4-hydroxybenzoate 3-monooxygenase n=1 Tax=unclassified Sphingomonas TaxID=196159 RepID=UPI0006FD1888|nr:MULTISPECIES: 4-hydroxybenzoate 3-monooxygenase [unclassified Sphingomonas]KQX23242.1 4-hydroxybenzoate 3-monooxygenase [Sphingomonas sp. Root1294]KQY68090.1 4-hydroxybenzoate 3-monooxygenase [Sphingomonas sp. Root50]KRB90982.1 4-hydroxybenzoate 3-monooxygenase [Sphingomonas sp. Root720]